MSFTQLSDVFGGIIFRSLVTSRLQQPLTMISGGGVARWVVIQQ
jgi:hypothetical protein